MLRNYHTNTRLESQKECKMQWGTSEEKRLACGNGGSAQQFLDQGCKVSSPPLIL